MLQTRTAATDEWRSPQCPHLIATSHLEVTQAFDLYRQLAGRADAPAVAYIRPPVPFPHRRRLPEGRTTGGAYVEAVDAKGNVVYRQSIEDPTRPSVQIHDAGRSYRVDAPGREVMLDNMVPECGWSSVDQRPPAAGPALPFSAP